MELRRTYRFDAIRASTHNQVIHEVFGQLQSAGVEPLLAKGWAAARLYPEPGLRTYDDFDVLVQAQQYAQAEAALQRDTHRNQVDLHTYFAELVDRPVTELYRRSVVIPMGDMGVRVLGAEDHLRLLCQHLLRHAAWRAVWLCDVAAALESLPPGFDWDYCLSGQARRSEWVRYTLALAQQLLGAREDNVPVPTQPLPHWLVGAVLREWGREDPPQAPSPLFRRHPSRRSVLDELRRRWPNPIVATIFWRAPFNGAPRLPLQAAMYAVSQFLALIGRRWTLGGFE